MRGGTTEGGVGGWGVVYINGAPRMGEGTNVHACRVCFVGVYCGMLLASCPELSVLWPCQPSLEWGRVRPVWSGEGGCFCACSVCVGLPGP